MFKFLGVKPGELNLMPGFAQKTKLFVIQIEEQKLFNMVERLGNRPRFAVMHVGWYKGSTITSMPHKYECYVTKQNKVKHAAYTFLYVLATFWGNDDFQPKLFRKGLPLAIQILGPRKMRLGLTDEGKEFLMQNVPRLTGNLSLVLRDEALGSSVDSTDAGGSTSGSLGSLPKEWQGTEIVYAVDVPPWCLQEDVEAMVSRGVKNKGLTEFKVGRVKWSVGAVRTLRGPLQAPAWASSLTRSSKAPTATSPQYKPTSMVGSSCFRQATPKAGPPVPEKTQRIPRLCRRQTP